MEGSRLVSMTKVKYPIVLERDEESGWYTVIVPDLPGCITQGKSIEDAEKNAVEAIEGHIESLEKHGDPVPFPERIEEVVEVNV